jgi:inorganic pyrophosphatase
MNWWKDLPSGRAVPQVVNVVVEIPKGSRNKYEFDAELGIVRLDRLLYSSVSFPGDYGLISQTLGEDGDPLDALVMVTEPTFSGCLIETRPLALLKMIDRGQADDKVLAVPSSDPLFRDYHAMGDLPQHLLREIAHFFSIYKDLEATQVEIRGWKNAAQAHKHIRQGVERYRSRFTT